MLIDKTKVLEDGFKRYPILFVEGAAACGKTTAVNMYMKVSSRGASSIFDMGTNMEKENLKVRLEEAEKSSNFFVFENMSENTDSEAVHIIAEFCEKIAGGQDVNVVIISRDKPDSSFLRLLWQGKMGMVLPSDLMLTQKEVTKFLVGSGSKLPYLEVYQKTGGWPGCVAALTSLEDRASDYNYSHNREALEDLFSRYEIQAYIKETIVGRLSAREQSILAAAAASPWVNEEMLKNIWQIIDSIETLRDLERKGLLIFKKTKGRWRIAPIVSSTREMEFPDKMGEWYEDKGQVAEALECYRREGAMKKYKDCAVKNYNKMSTSMILEAPVELWEDQDSSGLIYLRGMKNYLTQNFEGLKAEIEKAARLELKLAGTPEERIAGEIYLNLTFIDGSVDAEEWLSHLKNRRELCSPLRLYPFTENGYSFLSGYRELSAFFACSSKEEKSRMELLEETLDVNEWLAIRLARLSYSFETGKKNLIESKDWEAVLQVIENRKSLPSSCLVSCIYMLNKMNVVIKSPEIDEWIHLLEEIVTEEESVATRRYLQTIHNIYSLQGPENSSATRWLKAVSTDKTLQITEENYYIVFLIVKGLLTMNQPEYADRILRKLIPYLRAYHRSRMLAELLFQQALVDWAEGKEGAAIKNTVESFVYGGDYRYVTFYTSYGQRGSQVLNAYVDWLRNAEPEKWNGKKRYNYGNVLKMPKEEYFSLILRQAKRAGADLSKKEGDNFGSGKSGSTELVEKLTLMETIILQNINKGMSNSELCEELNLKLPTVKTHIFNLYKKLGVNSRVQAIVKGKEIGILG